MTRQRFLSLSSILLALALGPVACGGDTDAEGAASSAESSEAALRELDVAEASALFAGGEAHPVDANSESTRSSVGYVPGATLLSSSSEYALDELPDQGLLVFYCGSTQCTASDNAAARASEAGREVAVMRPGIRGWVDAGKPVAQVSGEAAPPSEEGNETEPS